MNTYGNELFLLKRILVFNILMFYLLNLVSIS